jgi:hypothetical protein
MKSAARTISIFNFGNRGPRRAGLVRWGGSTGDFGNSYGPLPILGSSAKNLRLIWVEFCSSNATKSLLFNFAFTKLLLCPPPPMFHPIQPKGTQENPRLRS